MPPGGGFLAAIPFWMKILGLALLALLLLCCIAAAIFKCFAVPAASDPMKMELVTIDAADGAGIARRQIRMVNSSAPAAHTASVRGRSHTVSVVESGMHTAQPQAPRLSVTAPLPDFDVSEVRASAVTMAGDEEASETRGGTNPMHQ